MSTYSNRHVETTTVTRVGDGGIEFGTGFGTGAFREVHDRLPVGTVVDVETRGFSTITGYRVAGTWLVRLSDEDLEEQHRQFVAENERRKREMLEKHRDDWTARTAALPDWIRTRIDSFRTAAGERFEVDGWGYELAIAELAVLYVESDFQDTPAVMEYASREGTSGHQHDVARMFASVRLHHPETSTAGTPSALTPLTGSPDYR